MESTEETTDRRVFLNVGGVRFETFLSTLRRLEYFDAAFRAEPALGATPENPYFVDRDGERFRHVLNFLRGGDERAVPEDAYEDFDFWGLEVDRAPPTDGVRTPWGNPILPPASLCDRRVEPEILPEDLLSSQRGQLFWKNSDVGCCSDQSSSRGCMCAYLHVDPAVTLHRRIHHRSTPICMLTVGTPLTFVPPMLPGDEERVHWEYDDETLRHGCTVQNFQAIFEWDSLPKRHGKVDADALVGLRIAVSIGGEKEGTVVHEIDLGMCVALAKEPPTRRSGWCYLPIYLGDQDKEDPQKTWMRTGDKGDWKLRFDVLNRTAAGYRMGFRWTENHVGDDDELKRFKTDSNDSFRLNWKGILPEPDGNFKLLPGYTRALLWKADSSVQTAALVRRPDDDGVHAVDRMVGNRYSGRRIPSRATTRHPLPTSYRLERPDFRFYERTKLKLQPLPDGWGCMNFGNPLDVVPDTGGFCVTADKEHFLLLDPPPPPDAILWQALVAVCDESKHFQPAPKLPPTAEEEEEEEEEIHVIFGE